MDWSPSASRNWTPLFRRLLAVRTVGRQFHLLFQLITDPASALYIPTTSSFSRTWSLVEPCSCIRINTLNRMRGGFVYPKMVRIVNYIYRLTFYKCNDTWNACHFSLSAYTIWYNLLYFRYYTQPALFQWPSQLGSFCIGLLGDTLLRGSCLSALLAYILCSACVL